MGQLHSPFAGAFLLLTTRLLDEFLGQGRPLLVGPGRCRAKLQEPRQILQEGLLHGIPGPQYRSVCGRSAALGTVPFKISFIPDIGYVIRQSA